MTSASAGWQGGDERNSGPIQKDLKTQPAEIPLAFFLPGLGGDEDPKLAAFWKPFAGVLRIAPLTYLDWTELVGPEADFSAVVSHVKSQIEEILPAGPVRLAGYSIGGHLAYACAREFHAEGRIVDCVAIFDAPADVQNLKLPLSKRLRQRLDRLLSFDLRGGLSSILAKSLTNPRSLPRLRKLIRYRHKPLPFRLEASLHRKFQMQMVLRLFPSWWNKVSCPPEVLATPTFLFRSQEHEADEREDLGWGDYFQTVTVIRVAGSHRGMLEPAVNAPLRAAFLSAMTTGSL
jgi:thioesterase domain-containing protein